MCHCCSTIYEFYNWRMNLMRICLCIIWYTYWIQAVILVAWQFYLWKFVHWDKRNWRRVLCLFRKCCQSLCNWVDRRKRLKDEWLPLVLSVGHFLWRWRAFRDEFGRGGLQSFTCFWKQTTAWIFPENQGIVETHGASFACARWKGSRVVSAVAKCLPRRLRRIRPFICFHR